VYYEPQYQIKVYYEQFEPRRDQHLDHR